MNNKKGLQQEEEKMKMMYSSEPCHLLKGMAVAVLIEAVAFGTLVGIGYLLASLF